MMSVQQQAPQGQPQAMPQAGGNQNVTPFHSASLYVGDLAPDITESTLFEIFNQVGPVASIRVCRDTITRRSLGYAYVNFHNVADAERALDTMNFTLIKDNPCRIMWSQRDPSMRRSGVGNVFVKNLDETIDNKALYDTFSLFGNILSCKVATDDAGNSKGYGYVHYETAESANEAIAKIDGMVVGGKQVHVGHFVRRNDRAGQADWTNIYVKNIPLAWDEEKLRSEFAKFGTINSVKIQRESSDPASLSRGFGFINFEDHEAAESAVSEMNGKTVSGPAVKKPAAAAAAAPAAAAAAKKEDGDVAAPAAAAKEEEKEAAKEGDKEAEAEKPAEGDKEAEKEPEAPAAAADAAADKEQPAAEEGAAAAAAAAAEPAADAEPEVETRELFCCRAQKRTERQRELQAKYEALKVERMNKYQGVNLYVKNLDEGVDEAALREAFATQGTITSVRIMKDAVTGNSKGFGFVCFSSPEEATKAVQEMNNRMVASKPIYVALAQRKEVRRAQLEAQYAQQRGGLGPRGPMGAMQPGMYGMGMPYMMPGQPGGMPQPPRAGGYPMMPQMMGPRGAPRGGPNSMQPYPGRGTYPMPAYAMGAMPVQQQQQQVPRRGASGGRGGAGGRGMPAGVAMQPGVVPGAGMNGAGRGVGAQPMGVPMGQMPAGVQQQQQRGVMPMQGMQQQRGASGGAQQQAQAGGVPQQGNFKYTQQVRNPPAQGQAPQMGGMMAGGGGAAMMGPPPQAESLTAQALAAASPEMQKNMIGERLYPLIHESQPELAGKITGMLLEMDNGELLHLLESPDSLKAKIQEALQVLEAHTTD